MKTNPSSPPPAPTHAGEHSPEPWQVVGSAIIRPDGQEVTSDRFMTQTDKIRAVACVNFCAGVSTDELMARINHAQGSLNSSPLKLLLNGEQIAKELRATSNAAYMALEAQLADLRKKLGERRRGRISGAKNYQKVARQIR